MSDARSIRNLAMVGFMGTGKSTVGRLVAELLQFGFVDTDVLIEGEVGRSVSDIFAGEGTKNLGCGAGSPTNPASGQTRCVVIYARENASEAVLKAPQPSLWTHRRSNAILVLSTA